MSFRSPSGPPASAKQIEYLASLLDERDLGTFREARYHLGLTQRQAAGKFTVGEASELIDRLVAGELEPIDGGDTPTSIATRNDPASELRTSIEVDRAAARQLREREELVSGLPADLLADELQRRGWCCIPPTD